MQDKKSKHVALEKCYNVLSSIQIKYNKTGKAHSFLLSWIQFRQLQTNINIL